MDMGSSEKKGKRFSRREVLVGGLAGAAAVAFGAGTASSAGAAALRSGGSDLRRATRATRRASKAGQTITWGLSAYPTSFNPFENKGLTAGELTTATHRGLLAYDQHGNLVPALATSVTAVGDLRYEIQLRSGVQFHNGASLTSRDVAFTLDAMKEPSLAASLSDYAEEIQSISIKSDDTLVLTLTAPDASLPSYLGTPYMPIISQKSDLASGNFIGCGPFTVTSSEEGASITCTRFDEYYKQGYPLAPAIHFETLAESASAVEALASGEVDIVDDLEWADFKSVQSNRNLRLLAHGGPFMYLVFNTKKEPCSSPQVRHAIGYAINRALVIADAFYGTGSPLLGPPMPPSSPYFNSGYANSWSYDASKTKDLLAKAGYPHGISVTLLSNAQYSYYTDIAVILESNLSAAGIDVSLDLPDWATQETDGISGDYDIAVMGSAGEVNDPSFLSLFLQGPPAFQRSFGFNSTQVNDLLAKGLRLSTVAERKPVYDQIQELMIEQAPIVPLIWRDQAYGARSNVSGFANLPGFLTFYSGYTLEQTSLV
jgi:ABC-type transport system substrate-binding protein